MKKKLKRRIYETTIKKKYIDLECMCDIKHFGHSPIVNRIGDMNNYLLSRSETQSKKKTQETKIRNKDYRIK